MKVLGCVIICKADEAFLPEFIRAWKTPGVDLVALNDQSDPATDLHGVDEVPFTWHEGAEKTVSVVDGLIEAAERYEADAVLKLDVDTVHFSTNWFDGIGAEWDAVGYQRKLPRYERNFYGLAYAITLETLKDVAQDYSEVPPIIKWEDIAISYRLQLLRKRVNILPHSRIEGADDTVFDDPVKFQGFDMVHCGQFGRRYRIEKGIRAMRLLTS